ncbi:MAG TPA: haloacid dehalogenase-like hydrolase [Micromonosporaceae bacterium]|nr:haloacid dehalogenase-like hydrolase [Micromonosporaceae bacterium]
MPAPVDRPFLLLWDVDHTLIETRGLGTELYVAAFEAVTGRPVQQVVEPTGRTEPAIFAQTLHRHGIEPSVELSRRYAAELADRYRRHAELLRRRGRILPGARDALAAIADLPSAVQTVLTGNLRPVAAVKLEVFGLDGFIDFDAGAYGEDADDRPCLVPVAQGRAAAVAGHPFHCGNTVLVGDTAQDVTAAHQGGARIVAVATGRDSEADLRAAGAEMVLPDLTDTAAFVRAVRRSLGAGTHDEA